MKTNILKSTWIGFDKVISRTYSRFDSLSIVSRQSDLRTYSAESSCETFSVGQCSPHAFPFEAKSQLASSHQFVLAILVACLTVFGVGNAWGDVTLYQETFGDNGSSNTVIADATTYSASTTYFTAGHQTSAVSNYSGDSKVGKNNVAASDNDGASGNSAVWFTGPASPAQTKTLFQVDNINISGYTSLSLKFNLYRTNGTNSNNYVTVKYTIDSGSEQTLSFTAPSNAAEWTWCTGSLSGTGSSLTIKFLHYTNGGYTMRLDDIILTGISAGYAVTYNNGGHGTVPSNTTASSVTLSDISATATGYTCTGWKANVAVTNTSTSASISAGTPIANGTGVTLSQATTFTAQWSANNYTIDLNNQSATTAGTSSIAVTYDATTNLTGTPAITKPTKTHYDFGGYYTAVDGGGSQIIDANGDVVASVSNYTSSTKQWIKADNVTLYAKWTEHGLKNYRTVCCTELGTIDGAATLTQGGNSVTISGWSDVANVGTYTVKMYKKNGGGTWDLVSGSTSGGSAGTQGTRTGITSGSKSVTYTGLVVESEYKFTIQAIAGSAAYCDGVETAVTEINSTDVSSTPFKFRYSIYIDNGSNSGWAHHYIEPTGNPDEGSVSISLGAHVDYYQFKIAGGFSGWWGQGSPESKIPANTKWTLNGSQNVWLNTGAGGSYTFTVDYSGTTNPGVTVTFPSADQAADYKIYFDKSAVADWGATLKYRIGNGSHNQNQNFTLVPGTDQFYVTTTPEYGSIDAWQIANNVAWSGTNSIYNYYHGDGNDITRATVYQDYAVDEDITIVPTSIHNTENSCQFWDVSKTSGMLTHTATITTPSHGTINIAYTDVSGTSQPTNTSTVADLAHRTILTITATPATGYTCTSLTVNGAAFTSGSTHILAADATIAATFTAQTSTVTLDNNNATSGSQQTVTATYDATMPLVTTADGTPAVAALTRTGYTFNGWWDETSGGNQYYTYSGSPKVIASARTWDKTGAQTLKAQWIVNQYTLTWDLQGGTVATAGTGAAAAATGTPSSSQDYGTALTAPIVTKTGYNFNVWSPSVAATMPAENTTYTASWTAQVYNITYKDQGDAAYSGNATAGVPTGAPTTHTYGSATALVDGVKDGYRFDGWFTDASCTVSAGSSIGATAKTADFTLYAKWTQVYTVTWHVGNGTWDVGKHNVTVGNTNVVSGSKIDAMPDAPADNTLSACASKFMGWSTHSWGATPKGTGTGEYDDLFTTVGGSPTISGTTHFYAVFAEVTEDKYWSMGTIDKLGSGTGYAAYDGTHTVTGSDGNSYTYESSYVMSNSGNQFKASSDCGRIYNTSSLGNINRIVLNYSAYKGQMKVYESDSQISSSGTTALTETVSGEDNEIYTYECSGKGYFIVIQEGSNAAKADVTVYFGSSASNYRTQCDANMIRVTYDANGGMTGCENETTDKREDYTVCATEPTRDYYTFEGWLCSADDEVYAANATIDDAVIDDDFTLIAQWTPVSYSITYNYNGGSAQVDPAPATSYTVESSDITLQTPTYGHNRFEGWYENADLSTGGVKTTIAAGSHENKTYYAKWATRHHIEFFKEGTLIGEMWRADDENMEDAVAGQGSVPSEPSAPTACSSKVFVGWSESEIDDETDDEPADLMKPAAGTVDEDKEYYAVWAIESSETGTVYLYNGSFEQVTSGTAYGNKGKWETSTVFGTGTAGEVRMSSNSSSGSMDLDLSDKTLATTITVTFKMKRYGTEAGTITLSCMDDGSTASFGSSPFSYPSGDDNWHDYSSTVTSVNNAKTNSIHFTSTSGKRVYVKDVVVSQIGTVYNYTAYSTSCCATKVTLSQNSPENGTIAFGKTSVGTCGGDKDVSLTITPAAGYQLATYSVATGDGKVASKSVSPDIALDNNSSAAQDITLTFASGASGAYDVTASFSEMVASAWTWTKHVGGATITTDPVEVYVGQKVQVDVAYEPAGLLSNHTNASAYNYSPSPWSNPNLGSPAKAGDHLTVTGTNAGSTSVVLNHNDGLTKTINYTVLALPLVHFVDNIHGETFANVVATVSGDQWTVTTTLPTPTHSAVDDPGASYNTCERQHLHLIGWIESEWADAHPNAEPGDITGAGAGNYYAAGANIDLVAQNGKTFYAVWAKFE